MSRSQGNLHANKPNNPIMKKYIITGIMAAIAATSAFAGTAVSKNVVAVEDPCLFRDNEFQVDLFGLGDFYRGNSGNIGGVNQRTFSGRPAWGGGIGMNYIFARYFGIGIEQDVFGRNSGGYPGANFGYTRWATLGQLIFRYPICSWNLAPYAVIGGGAMYGNWQTAAGAGGLPAGQRYKMAGQGVGLVGGGLEYRITENIGLFSDARYLFSNVANLPNNQLMWRYGLRFAF